MEVTYNELGNGLFELEDSKYRDHKTNKIKPVIFKIEDGCWIVVSHKISRGGKGYPKISRRAYPSKNKTTGVQGGRWIWFLKTGEPVPEGMVIRHKCDNRRCINPDHLELGTHIDNMRDMRERGRHKTAHGDNNSSIRAWEIAQLFKSNPNLTVTAVVKMFNYDENSVRAIRNNESWKGVLWDLPEELLPFLHYSSKLTPYELKSLVLDLKARTDTQRNLASKYGLKLRGVEEIQRKRKDGIYGEEYRDA